MGHRRGTSTWDIEDALTGETGLSAALARSRGWDHQTAIGKVSVGVPIVSFTAALRIAREVLRATRLPPADKRSPPFVEFDAE